MEEKLGMARIPTPICPVCGEGGTIIVQMNDYLLWTSPNRPKIQDCFPSLSADLREQILTGTHPKCWEILFPPEEEEWTEEQVEDFTKWMAAGEPASWNEEVTK